VGDVPGPCLFTLLPLVFAMLFDVRLAEGIAVCECCESGKLEYVGRKSTVFDSVL
jgi:hypothetical protein